MAIFKGAGVAIVTPMYEDGKVNYDKLEELLEYQIANSTDAIIICGTTGESSTMTHGEHLKTIKFAIDKAIDSRTMAMNAAADYIRAIATSPDAAARVAALNTDTQAKMVSAYSDFYRTRLSRDELVLKSKLAKIDSNVDVWKMQKANATDSARVKVSALAAAADSFAWAASAALSSLNSVVSSATNAFT